METIDLYSEIGGVLSQVESIQVLSSLRQDPLVWQSVQKPEFLRAALETAGSQVGCWSPGHLALSSTASPGAVGLKPDGLRSEPLAALGHALQEKALRIYQATQRSATPPASLADAGLLALALRERRRLTGTWSGLLQEILPRPAQAEALFPVWRTALACLYAIIPDAVDMLRALMPKSIQDIPLDWIVLAQLAQPFTRQEHIQAFAQVLKGLPVSLQLGALRRLSLHGQESMAAAIAGQLLVGHPAFTNLRAHTQENGLDLANLSTRALLLQQMGTFYHLSGDHEQALSLYNTTETTLQEWLAGLYLQRINLRAGEKEDEAGVMMASGQLALLASSAGKLQNELGVALVNHPYASSILEQVQGEQDGAFLAIKRAALMDGSEPALARDLARQASLELLDEIRRQGIPFSGEFVYTWRPQETLQILLDLGLRDEANALANAMVEARPADLGLLHLSARILEQTGETARALQAQKIVVALDPSTPGWRKALADLWAKVGDWDRSFDEWKTVLSLCEQPDLADRVACAQAALQAGVMHEARAMSEAILNEDANNGPALGIMGQALIGTGESQAALNYLVRATLLNPEALSPWLALAKVQREMGEPQRALETLRAAVTALPEDPEAHLAYGEACTKLGLLAESLPHLKKAFLLSPEAGSAALMYGQALRHLGHLTEARAVFEKVRSKWPARPELAYEYAQVLLDQNDAEAALPVLEAALRNGLPVLDGYLLYAKILLGEYRTNEDNWDAAAFSGRMQQADLALRRILEIDPANQEARFLRADILREKGDLEEALVAYRQLADSPDATSPDLGWRVQWGMARAALCLNRADTAVAAYREAIQARPDSLMLRRGLAEATLLANLPQEALEAGNDALNMASDNVENLAWFAEFAARLGENQKAAAALERAVQINPQRPDLLVSLAQWQMSAGDLEAARSTLQSIPHLTGVRCPNQQNILRRAAHMYLRMEDNESALACFELALQADSTPEPGLCFEAAELHTRMGNLEPALELAQTAQETAPGSIPVYLLQSDLLGELNRPQAALAVLEHALRLVQGSEGDAGKLPEEQRGQVGEIHERFTRLMFQEGNLPSALYHAEKAFELQPKRAALATCAADLAYALLQTDRAGRILAESLPESGPVPQGCLEQGEDGLDLLCMQIEAALATGRDASAQQWVEEGWSLAPNTPRLLAAEVCLLARQGNLGEARKVYESLAQIVTQDSKNESTDRPLWLVEAALEAQAWNESVEFAEAYAAGHPLEARAHLAHARALVLSAEQQRLCAAAGCITNAPGLQALEDTCQVKFNAAIQAASRLANVTETSRWQVRGEAAFTPTAQTARALAQIPADPEDVAALVGALRVLNNRSAAIQVSRRYPQHEKVLLQLALCYLEEDPQEGLAVAEKAVDNAPNHALAHAVLARLAAKTDVVNRAIESYEKALEIWPGEPVWHAAAGDLYIQVGTVQQAAWHRKQALDLQPDNAGYAYKLGEAYLAQGDTAQAVTYLERSTALDDQQAEVWLALASAYHGNEQLSQAMEAAKKAGSLNPVSAEPLLIAGETALSLAKVDQAYELAQNALRREPENARALLFLCSVLALRGKQGEALLAIESAAPSVKQAFPIAFERAKLIHKVHGPQPALEVLEKLVRDYPDEPALLNFLAMTHAEHGDPKAAERYAFKSLHMDPDQPELTLMLGRQQRKTGQLDQAIHLLSEAVRMSPDNLGAYLEIAAVYQERRETPQALQVYRQVMNIAPDDYQAYYQSGLILRDSKDYGGAEAMLRRAAELAPENLSIRRQLVGVIALNLVHNKPEVTIS